MGSRESGSGYEAIDTGSTPVGATIIFQLKQRLTFFVVVLYVTFYVTLALIFFKLALRIPRSRINRRQLTFRSQKLPVRSPAKANYFSSMEN